MMTGELTFVAICTCSRNAVAFGVDRSRSLKYAGSFAQLCSPARLAVPALLALLRALLRDLKNLSAVTHGAKIFQVRRAASDADVDFVFETVETVAAPFGIRSQLRLPSL